MRERLADIQAASESIASYLEREGSDDDLVFDAIRVRLIEIGEAVKDIDPKLLEGEPSIPWTESRACETSSHIAISILRTRSFERPKPTTFRPLLQRSSGSSNGSPPTRIDPFRVNKKSAASPPPRCSSASNQDADAAQ